MIDHLYDVLEAARAASFPEVTVIYKDDIPDAKPEKCSIGLIADDKEFIPTGENARSAVKQTIYIVINILLYNRSEGAVIADLRTTAAKVKAVLKANLRLNDFLVLPGRILGAQEAQAQPGGEKSRLYEITFEGKYFEGGES